MIYGNEKVRKMTVRDEVQTLIGESVRDITYQTLVDVALYNAKAVPLDIAYVQLGARGGTTEISYGELDKQCRQIAAQLQNRFPQGSRILLAQPNGIGVIVSFFACLYAGMIAVPVYPPFAKNEWPRFTAIAKDCNACAILTSTDRENDIRELVKSGSGYDFMLGIQCHAVESFTSMDVKAECAWVHPDINGNTIAFLQYTSGTTGQPKGVMVSHANILHNLAMITERFQHDQSSIMLGWLPLFHDMGLIGVTLSPFYVGFKSIVMEPISFLRKPLNWLTAISEYGATTSGAPNFAYETCLRRITPEDKRELDLSSWKNAFNGAEKVQARTVEQFTRYFSDCGFRPEAFLPCYGMAETTLFVAGNPATQVPNVVTLDKSAVEAGKVQTKTITGKYPVVSCGVPVDSEIRIVNPESKMSCSGGEIGEVWISGKHVAQGYWNKQQETRETFKATTSDTGEGPFLRSGDLGFIMDKELYITGRIKELIIIRGKNYYPQDIELTAQSSISALRIGRGAAFGVTVAAEEQLVLVQEVVSKKLAVFDREEAEYAVRSALRLYMNLEVHDIVFVKQASVGLTSSGKVRRALVKQQYLQNSLVTILPSPKRFQCV